MKLHVKLHVCVCSRFQLFVFVSLCTFICKIFCTLCSLCNCDGFGNVGTWNIVYVLLCIEQPLLNNLYLGMHTTAYNIAVVAVSLLQARLAGHSHFVEPPIPTTAASTTTLFQHSRNRISQHHCHSPLPTIKRQTSMHCP